ncbi:MAG TPA: L-dopachrome tautomerase-related protein [Chthoniobacterales bacterium]|jgi:sugar lactone lactonase YvrE
MKAISLGALACFSAISFCSAAELEEVASFPSQQVTGVGVSKSGRVFVNFPDWSDDHTISVAEIIEGKPKPFPNEDLNKPGPAGSHFVCVQSVVVDGQDDLWILDPAAPKMKEIVKGGPKLMKVDLKTNQVVQTIPFGEDIAPRKSYLNDVRVDPNARVAFITESGKGAIVVVDLKSGKARRLLDGHQSTQPEPGVKLVVDGRELRDEQKKTAPQIASDGIALDLKNDYLYYHALTGHTLYRIKTAYLKDANLSKSDLESKVENVAKTPAPDGILESPDGSIYLTALEENAIVHLDPATKNIDTIVADKRLSWPDTMSWGPGGAFYVTVSQIQNMPRFNGGRNARVDPYKVFKITGIAAAP